MKTIAALLALLATGCGAAPDLTPPARDAAADAPAADVVADAGWPGVDVVECRAPYIRCSDGRCILVDSNNCGACGRVCPERTTCCADGPGSFCWPSNTCQRP